MRGISIAMPICRAHPDLGRAIACLLGQELDGLELDVMLVVNGGDSAAATATKEWADRDARIRVLKLGPPSLAKALNLALREARFDLVARMDDDDVCPTGRLALQARYMQINPDLAGVGCAWELVEPDGGIQIQRPPTEPAALRSRLLLGNCLAHGSMMLRRDLVLDAGCYDETLDRAQDYDLWLRLSRDLHLGCLAEVLYRHHAAGVSACSSEAQALAAARAMLRAWRDLPEGDDEALDGAIARGLQSASPADGVRGDLSAGLDASPTREGLLSRLWIDWLHPPMGREAMDICRRARLREVGAMLRERGVQSVWLWGGGNHGAWVIEHRDDLGLEIAGVVDDGGATSEVGGFSVGSPMDLDAGQTVLIASDTFERDIWKRSASLRARGVGVVRLYGDDASLAVVPS